MPKKPLKPEKLVEARRLLFALLHEIEEQNEDSKREHLKNLSEVEQMSGLYKSAMENNTKLESMNALLKKENKKYILKVLEIKELNIKVKELNKAVRSKETECRQLNTKLTKLKSKGVKE